MSLLGAGFYAVALSLLIFLGCLPFRGSTRRKTSSPDSIITVNADARPRKRNRTRSMTAMSEQPEEWDARNFSKEIPVWPSLATQELVHAKEHSWSSSSVFARGREIARNAHKVVQSFLHRSAGESAVEPASRGQHNAAEYVVLIAVFALCQVGVIVWILYIKGANMVVGAKSSLCALFCWPAGTLACLYPLDTAPLEATKVEATKLEAAEVETGQTNVGPDPHFPTKTLDQGASSSFLNLAKEERIEWLNEIVARLWPNIEKAAQQIVKEQVEPMLQATLPMGLKSTHFKSFALGANTPVLGPIKVYPNANGVKILLMINYNAGLDIELSTGIVDIGLTSVKFAGELTLRLEPFIDELPVVGAAIAYFLNPPKIELDFAGVTHIADFPGLANIVRRTIDMVVASVCVLPNVITVPLASVEQGVDRAYLNQPKPLGVLRVTALSAKDLRGSDWHMLGQATSDPYVRVQIADQHWESSTVYKTCSPTWKQEDTFDFIAYDREQLVHVEIWDNDTFSKDDLIGRIEAMKVAEILPWSEKPLPVLGPKEEDKQCGSLLLKLEMFNLVPKQRGCDGCLVVVKVEDVLMPLKLGGAASLRAEFLGVKKKTRMGAPADPEASTEAVAQTITEVVKRAKAMFMNDAELAKMMGVDKEDVPALLEGKRVRHTAKSITDSTCVSSKVESAMFFPVSNEALDGASVQLSLLVGKREKEFGQVNISMKDVLAAPNLTLPGPVDFVSDSSEHIEAQIEVSVWALTPCSGDGFQPQGSEQRPLLQRTGHRNHVYF